jgi:fructosamine-3-kinase
MESFAAIGHELAALTGSVCADAPERSIGGGSINRCYRWRSASGPLFVKIGTRSAQGAFAAEAEGLRELGATRTLRVPEVLATGIVDAAAFLALEWIERGASDPGCERRLGAGLAALHGAYAPRFGWRRDNTIGRTPQANAWSADWVEFFRERRLRPQLMLAKRNGFASLLAERGERLLAALPVLASTEGEPVLIDPAVYYGDRETDLAMTHLFGGFGATFYRAYNEAAPLPAGAALRAQLYNLYHVLNHVNLFGGGYAPQARAIIDRLLAEVG